MWEAIFLFSLFFALIFMVITYVTDSGATGIIALILGVMMFVSMFGCLIDNTRQEIAIYNHGIHQEDNGNWVLVQAVGHQYRTDYIYKCDKCGKTIEVECEPENMINH